MSTKNQIEFITHHEAINLTEEEHERFWSKVNKNGNTPRHMPELGECWVWTAGVWGRGYGAFHFRGKQIKSHRLSYLSEIGKIDFETPFVLHHCDNRLCVRPEHLFLGDYEKNSHDMCAKGRHKTTRGDDHYLRKNPDKIRHGTQVPQAKLTEKLVSEIRKIYKERKRNQYELAKDYNVSVASICFLLNRKTWKHVS